MRITIPLLIILLIPLSAAADKVDSTTTTTTTNNYYYTTPGTTGTNSVEVQSTSYEGECGSSIAMAMGGQQYDHATNALQIAVSGATYRGCDAIAVGAGTKISERVLINGAGGYARGEWAGVVSATMRF